ncbi:MAG: hypothetical protein LEGION0398_MBIBDBAK_00140 [Legionellaceae bacterium]
MENQDDILAVLRNCAIFNELSDNQIERIVPHLYQVYYHSGSFIIQQGELGTELFIIKQGSVEVLKKINQTGKFHRLTSISSSEVFGELAIIDNGYRSASIRAIQPTTLLVLSAAALQTLDSEIVAGIYKGLAINLSQRLRFINDVTTKSLDKERKEKRNYNLITICIMLVFICGLIYSYSLGSTSCLLSPLGMSTAMTKSVNQTNNNEPVHNQEKLSQPQEQTRIPSINHQFE